MIRNGKKNIINNWVSSLNGSKKYIEIDLEFTYYKNIYNKKACKLFKLNFIILLVVIFILTICLLNYLISKQKRDTYLNAGKKWDGIVKELRRRK